MTGKATVVDPSQKQTVPKPDGLSEWALRSDLGLSPFQTMVCHSHAAMALREAPGKEN